MARPRELSDESIAHQVEQFLAWQAKTGGTFEEWTKSKGHALGDVDRMLFALAKRSAVA